MRFVVRCFVAAAALSVLVVPALASAAPPSSAPKARRTARVQKNDKSEKNERSEAKACTKPVVEVVAGAESATFSLARCDGKPAPQSVEQLSVLARPASSPKPKQPLDALAKSKGTEIAPGVRRIDPRLVERLELAVEHFHKQGQAPRVQLVSGYRPKSAGSYHQTGRALDFRIDGVTNEALVAFCKTLPDTGCGYYPNSLFVHMDVRDGGAGHVAWIDASHPGEPPKYVSAWPPPKDNALSLPALPGTDSPSDIRDGGDSGKRRRDGHVSFF